jgi:hypothetical protein
VFLKNTTKNVTEFGLKERDFIYGLFLALTGCLASETTGK